jgi:hypothetical protein
MYVYHCTHMHMYEYFKKEEIHNDPIDIYVYLYVLIYYSIEIYTCIHTFIYIPLFIFVYIFIYNKVNI